MSTLRGSDLRELAAWAKSLGFTCEVTGSTQLAFRRPNTQSVFASYTPSCRHARKNTKRDLQRVIREAEQRQQVSPGK